MGSRATPDLEDRLSLACATYDEVVQRLFAIGMGLQSLIQLTDDPVLIERLNRYLAELDETIAETRDRVLELRQAADPRLLADRLSISAPARDVVF